MLGVEFSVFDVRYPGMGNADTPGCVFPLQSPGSSPPRRVWSIQDFRAVPSARSPALGLGFRASIGG